MSKKFSKTTADYLEWGEAMNLVAKLQKEGKPKFSLLVAFGCFWGLRISDLLSLKWAQVLDADTLYIIEKKTKKHRLIPINKALKDHIKECFLKTKPNALDDFCFASPRGGVYTPQRINILFKELKCKYRLKTENFSTHSLRKTFGRRVFDLAAPNSEEALVKLSELLNHNSTAVTRRYLGLRREEIAEIYAGLSF